MTSPEPSDYEFAGNMVEKHDYCDISSPSFLELTGISQNAFFGTSSGLNDYDYQDLANLTGGRVKSINQITTFNKVPIPPEIMEHFKNIKCHCMMGLFPEIGRAWLTIDSDIYIWTYEHSRDVAYFDGLSHLIVSVGLIKPKPNVFINDVKYLLVLTTPIEIIILGVTFGDTTKTISSPNKAFVSSTYEEMQLMNKPIFVLNTDNIAINCVEGTADGRIFMGGRDGCLYEIAYQAESNWFGKRCKKINHSQGLMSLVVPGFLKVFSEIDAIVKITVDNSRNLLYTLSEKGAIEAWDLSDNLTRRIARLTQNDIANAAVNVIKTVDLSVFMTVIALCPISKEESAQVNFIAVTQSGVRLYFSTIQISLCYQQQQNNNLTDQQLKPQNLYLLHVRLPPGYTPNTNVGKPKQVHSAYYNSGSLLMVSTPQQDHDLLWSLSSEPFPLRTFLTESSTIMPVDGQVWAIAEVKEKTTLSIKYPLKEAQTPKKVVLLTSQGAHIVELLKPIDLLQQVLFASHGTQNDAVKVFFEVQSEPHSCANSLLLACMESLRGTEISMWAKNAFYRFGGEAFFVQSQANRTIESNESPRIFMSTPYPQSRPASSIQQSLQQQTQFPNNSMSTYQQQTPEVANLKYSAKHAGLYLYVARLLRPIWNRTCMDNKCCSTITIQDCSQLLNDLYALKSFLELNSVNNFAGMTKMSTMPNTVMNTNGQNNHLNREEAHVEEMKSIEALVRLIKHTSEVISLWKILCEHQFNLLINHLTLDQKQLLMTCTFRDLILTRTELCALLIVTIINSYLNDNASVKSISDKLREDCPTLYRNEDAVSHKATEILLLSKGCLDAEEKDESLFRALELCKEAVPKLPLSNICQQFNAVGFYQGVLELCASYAYKIDPNDTALHYYKNNDVIDFNHVQPRDQEGYMAYTARMKCYEEITLMLEQIFQNLCISNTNIDLIKCGTVLDDREKNINNQILTIVNVALQSPDQMLHISVYEWMLNHNMLGELLGTSRSSLGEFLGRSISQTPINLKMADLLWKYYERNNQHSSSAKILNKLALVQSDVIPLSQRIEYLARAVICMRSDSIGYSVHNGELLREIEDKLEIAQLQKKILDTLANNLVENVDAAHVREALKVLDMRLYNMSQLYSEFADVFGLWECKLEILNSSHHNDKLLINCVWGQILNKEVEGSGSATEKAQRIISKVQSFASEHGNSGQCFPQSFLVRELELRCFKLRIVDSPVPEALLKMNLDIDNIVDIYLQMITANDRIWLENDELYLIRAITHLLTLLSQNNLALAKNRRRAIAKAEDLISATLNILYTKQVKEAIQKYIDDLRVIRQNYKSLA